MNTFLSIFAGKNFGRLYLATIWSFFSMGFIYHIVTVPIEKDALRFVDTILGFLMGTIVAGILGYYFGSSQSASDKDDIIKGHLPDISKSVTVTESSTTKPEVKP